MAADWLTLSVFWVKDWE